MKNSNGIKYIIGIDEAGRGPLAGPVAVGVCALPANMKRKEFLQKAGSKKLKDSKKLTEKMRDMWFAKMQKMQKAGEMAFAVTLISNKVIDEKGLSFAIKKAMLDSLKKVKKSAQFKLSNPTKCLVLLDGSLHAPAEYTFQKTIIKGDEKEFSISLASIAAKVIRDTHMKKLAKKYPLYGFEIHKGYGTAQHIAMIRKKGVSQVHRESFLTRIV